MTDEPKLASAEDEHALTPQELRLIECAAKGEWWEPLEVDGKAPDMDPAKANDWDMARTLRADVIRCLAVGDVWSTQTQAWPISAKGILVSGAQISGVLDLEGVTVERLLCFQSCVFDGTVELSDARTRAVSFDGSHLFRLTAERAKIDGGLYLRNGFAAKGEVRLRMADIKGQFSCSGGIFENPDGQALAADSIRVGASLYLDHGFTAKGEVDLTGAKITGQFSCENGRFEKQDGRALDADTITVGGNVFLRHGFTAIGEVNFTRATIGGNLRGEGGSFDNATGDALDLSSVEIGAGLFLHALIPPEGCKNGMAGRLLLSQAKCRTYRDDQGSWPEPGKLVLDGFTYDRFAECDTDWRQRRLWLRRQNVDHIVDRYSPQPWTQAISVLRAMGHDREARRLAICRETVRLKSKSTGYWSKFWMALSYVTVGFGYRPWLALVWSALFVSVGWWMFASAASLGYMAPRDGAVRRSDEWNNPAKGHLLRPTLPRTYPPFNGLIYALDGYLPVIEFGQDEAWEPSSVRTVPVIHSALDWTEDAYVPKPPEWFFTKGVHRFVYWANEILGWLFITLFVAGMSGLMKKE